MAPTFFPFLVQTLVDYLLLDESQVYLDCPVASEVPNPRPPKYVALFTVPVGGPQRANVLTTRRISAQCDAGSEFLSGTLAETVCALLIDSKYQGLGIKSVNVIGLPARFPGPAQPNRWQVTADFMIRAKASVM